MADGRSVWTTGECRAMLQVGGIVRGLLGSLVVIAVLGLALAACGEVTPTPGERCDGVTAYAGGCDPRRPVFTGTTCDELADQWGRGVDRWVRGIMAEPAKVGDKARSARIADAFIASTIGLANRLGRDGRHGECSVEAILAGADDQFTAELRAGLGAAMYDGDPALTWDQVLDEMRRFLAVLEATPIELPSTGEA